MGNNNALATILVGTLIVVASWIVCHLYNTFKLYQFFNSYVGYAHSHHIVNYKHVKRLYRCLSLIRKSINGEDLFDVAMITHFRRLSDQDIYEKTKAMLHAIEPNYYKKSQFMFNYTESEVQRHCFDLIGSSNKPDMIRYLLWIILINPIGVRHLKELK